MGSRHAVPLAIALCALLRAPASLQAQSGTCVPGAPEVREVSFSGNTSVPAGALEDAIETRASSGMRRITRVFGARECLVKGALVRDVARLMLYYRRLGFPRVAVDTLIVRPDSGAVNVAFSIREGAPIVATSVELRGVTDSALRAQLQPAVQLRAGQPLSRFALDSSTAGVLLALLRAGYLKGTASAQARVDSAASRAVAWIDVVTGPLVRVGEVRVDARGVNETEPRLPAERVRGLTGLEPGSVLRSQDLTDAARVLDAVGLFDDVRIAVDSVRGPPVGEAIADVSVSTVEGLANQLRLAAGYATLDCFRLQLRHQHAGVFRRAGRFELTTNLSKIAIGSPLDFAPSLCSSEAQDDPYSRQLNYYVGGTYSIDAPGGGGIARSATIYTERRSEYLAFLKTTYLGGSAALSKSLGGHWSATVAYDLSYSKTVAEPAVLCATFNACLEEDRERFTEALPFGLVSLTGSYDKTDNPADPTRGRTLRLQLRAAPQWLGTAVREQVIGGRLAGTAYVPLSPRTVLAARVQGAVIASLPGADFIPQSERIFLGGASSVRGFRQNEVGPRVYIADSVRTVIAGPDTLLWALPPDSASWRAVPSGGTAGVNVNLELRMRPPILTSSVQFVAFLDGGVIWNRGESELNSTPFVLTPGIGLRVSTIIGPIRFDIASNGYAPPAGPAYRDVSVGFETAPLYCVSVGNTLPVTGFNQVDSEGRPIPPVQAEGPCPSTFKPARAPRFFDRLTINFSIGQAF